jgi:hypothetical protein
VRAGVAGRATNQHAAALTYVQTPRVGQPWWAGGYADGTALYAVPGPRARIGSFAVYAHVGLSAANGDAYDLIRSLGGRFPPDPSFVVTDAERARLARIDQRFSADTHTRYGFVEGDVVAGASFSVDLPAARTDFVSPGVDWMEEVSREGIVSAPAVIAEPVRRYEPGSRQTKSWWQAPLRPDWLDEPSPSLCAPDPIRRTTGNLHVSLADVVDAHGRFDCLRGDPEWSSAVTRRLTLHRDGALVGAVAGPSADFTAPRAAGVFRLTYEWDAGALLPSSSSRVRTAWTFRSAGPRSSSSIPVPLLSVDYSDAASGALTMDVRQASGLPSQRVTAFSLWTSTDDGRTWTVAQVRTLSDTRFAAALPSAGDAPVSLRVMVSGDGGSAFEQTIIRALPAA